MGVARVRGGRSRWQVWVTALRSGRAPWAGCSRGPGLPGLSWAAAWSWDGACYHILSLPCPAGHSLWPENFLVPERHDQLLRRSHHMSYFSERERKNKNKTHLFQQGPWLGAHCGFKIVTSFSPKAVTGLTLSLSLPADVPDALPFSRRERVGGGEGRPASAPAYVPGRGRGTAGTPAREKTPSPPANQSRSQRIGFSPRPQAIARPRPVLQTWRLTQFWRAKEPECDSTPDFQWGSFYTSDAFSG